MKDAFVTIHGHFYQPPRENPWLEAIETEKSAHPYHDWNERITFECYRPNAFAQILEGGGKILDIINNYASINFNFGPTLLSWIEKKAPFVYQKILEADRESLRRLGFGNAIAQIYNHIILPLANERDKETEVRWGIADFEKRFRRRPDAIWLPETAVNYPTLRVLVKHGLQYLILSPFQALRIRPLGSKKWTDVTGGRIDPTQPYRCFLKSSSGKKVFEQFIDLFFYDGTIAKEVSFGELLRDGKALSDRFAKACHPSKGRPQLIHIATDGETYGHHKKFGDMALAYALKEGFSSRGLEMTNYRNFLKRCPPIYEVEIDEGAKGEGSSWSCVHGVGRWKEDCGCHTGGREGWNQKWRKPLREAIDLLRDELALIFQQEGEGVFKEVWEARDSYIDVILDRSSANLDRFFERYGRYGIDKKKRIRGLRLLEMEKHALQMYASCGWFFADLAGLETIIILQHAARAIQLAEALTGKEIEKEFLEHLSDAKSNLPEMGRGDQVYEGFVKPRCVTLDRVVNHYAISSLFDREGKEGKIFSYRIENVQVENLEKGGRWAALGRVTVVPDVVPEPREFLFGLIPSKPDIFRTWVLECTEGLPDWETLKGEVLEMLGRGEVEMEKTLTSLLGNRMFALRDIFEEEKQAILEKLIEKETAAFGQLCTEIFNKVKPLIETLAREGMEIPLEIRGVAEVALSRRLWMEVNSLKTNFKATLQRGEIEQIVKEAKRFGFRLPKERSGGILSDLLREKMGQLQKGLHSDPLGQSDSIEAIITFLRSAKKWGIELSKIEVQDIMGEILKEYVWTLEKSWWEDGRPPKPFPPQLLLLAEDLGFYVERYSKMVPMGISIGPED